MDKVRARQIRVLRDCYEEDLISKEEAEELAKRLTANYVVITHAGTILRGDEVAAAPESVLQGAPPSVNVAASGSSGSRLAQLAAATTSSSGKTSPQRPHRSTAIQYKTIKLTPKTQEEYDIVCQLAAETYPGATIVIQTPPPPPTPAKAKAPPPDITPVCETM